jgi:predicted membrane-bound spermidine synthase
METRKMRNMQGRWHLYVLVSVSGAAVLAIELLGTRVLGPFYGVSLFLWSALISVTLAALSAGYALGGRMADKTASYSRLAAIMAGAGVWLLFVPWMRRFVLQFTEPLGLRIAVLAATSILFFPPLMLLGMVSPFAIKLRAQSLDEVGRSAGNLYAASTLASVGGALLTGFVLIPAVGVSKLLFIIGALLLLAAAFAMFARQEQSRTSVAAAIILVVAGVSAPALRVTEATGGCVVALEESPYAEIMVMDYLDARFLLIDGSIHTFIDSSTGETLFPYVNVIDIAGYFFDRPGSLCLLGLGGGSVSRHFAREGWEVDGVEIDPVVIRFAYEHFYLDSTDADIYEMDGRRFLRESDQVYDIIVFDAFGGGNIPFQLVTREAFELASSRLRPDGILALNIEAVGWRDRIVGGVAATLGTCFENIVALPIAEPPNTLGNVILLASNRALELPRDLPTPTWRFSAEYDRAHAWDNRFEPDTRGAMILTDDRNPVALWGERINFAARKQLHAYFKDAAVAW